MTIYIDIVMSILETISMMSYTDEELLEYIDEHYDEIECELNGEEYKYIKISRNERTGNLITTK